ncbi:MULTISPECIES: hypothetical protein [Streptomyces]|uniref:Streptomyces killer toxin-like beta/gamma crystallin domain-containing protein n=1 Tax=Streptomyces xanthochromogenes TaxID=67384 RepID=A0ABQ2ZD27_9ACTN|nr:MULTISPECIES: hypothetical protein [Streptomyces]MYV94953.1 hypothetical protein [Streptomyces sp. SID1034]GGY13039.1 hypothetical protein GCM10010326_00230 [Streptomyces xanthochromogenes]
MPKLGKPKRAMIKKAAQLTAGVVASCGLMLAAPATAHASSGPTAATPHVMRPNATTPNCGLAVEVHFYSGDWSCISSNGIHYVDFYNVNWVETGNQWAALVYNGGNYQPGMPPGTFWNKGNSITRIDVNT